MKLRELKQKIANLPEDLEVYIDTEDGELLDFEDIYIEYLLDSRVGVLK